MLQWDFKSSTNCIKSWWVTVREHQWPLFWFFEFFVWQQGHVSINNRLVLSSPCRLFGLSRILFVIFHCHSSVALIFLLKKSAFTGTLYAYLSFDSPAQIWGFCFSCCFAPMLTIFVSCVTLIVLSSSLSSWLVGLAKKKSERLRIYAMGNFLSFSYFLAPVWSRRSHTNSRFEHGVKIEKIEERCLLDLPELPLHCILDRLSPEGLYSMAAVSTSLRDECLSDYYWKKHLRIKWGKILGKSAYIEWQRYVAAHNRSISLSNQNFLRCNEIQAEQSSMEFYLALENGKFWFPAQVYNRENGHAGFLLSCYDAKVRYDSATDTFHARYSPHGRQTLEEGIEWGRIRAPAVETQANTLHISDCLDCLQPGDHIEIQWRRNKEFPYGWWYGVVGHMEICEGDEDHCSCHQSDTIVLEFKQYAEGSRWRKKMVKRDSHREEGDTVDGFYGGIRKLFKNEEIFTWKRLWPSKTLL